jgi:cation:H+ antiporter
MLENSIYVLAGFALLMIGADKFVTGAASIAKILGVSPLIIGLTIVGFGTSAPEMLISGMASWDGNPGLAIGNAIGSNIANIALVLGATALIIPLDVKSETLRREYPILFAIMLATLMLLTDGELSRIDGYLLIAGFCVMMYLVVSLGMRSRRTDPIKTEFEAEIKITLSTKMAIFWFLVGLTLLLLGSRVLVSGAVDIAKELGVSDLVIGLTIVAIGTSLPELAASIMSAIKKEPDIAIGNIIGSNMFNLLAVLGLPGIIAPGIVPAMVLERDFPVMIGITLALFAMAYGFRGPGRLNRYEGGLLLLAFAGYQVLVYYSGN